MLTVHDGTHLDALWDMASLVAEGAVSVNPAEAYVLGASILLHDSAMCVAAYPGGLHEVKKTLAWKDSVARAAMSSEESGGERFAVENPPDWVVKKVLPDVLRLLHAERAEVLAGQSWADPDGTPVFLIEDSELCKFFGPTIGRIAHSHWWPIHKVEQELTGDLGALASHSVNKVDRIKLACLLRIADALHLDSRRAPRFLRLLINPSGVSEQHWSFQEKMARPQIELDAVVFTTGQPFQRKDAEAWWLANDTLNAVDRELRDVDQLLQGCGREVLKARRVKGAGSPELLARSVETRGWRPVDARIQASDVPRIVETLGGSKLYGNNPRVAVRELIQNSADAVQARRKYERREPGWGKIKVGFRKEGSDTWLFVEDSGIGMSEQVLTGPLLDFGTSFWRSSLATEEFPGLMAAGMNAIGRYGIGFFSVFMLGKKVRVYSRRCDMGKSEGRMLEFHEGIGSRPILSPFVDAPMPIDGGTRVEVLLEKDPKEEGGLLHTNNLFKEKVPLAALVGSVAPNLDVALEVIDEIGPKPVTDPGDWLEIGTQALLHRIEPSAQIAHMLSKSQKAQYDLLQPLVESDNRVVGRALISPDRYSLWSAGGCVTISGLRSSGLRNVAGILLGEALTASREAARPLASKEALAKWASGQARLIAKSTEDEERQALSAEIVLECGGDVSNLKVIRWGSDWLNSAEFEERLRASTKIAISFGGDFDYDEDEDDVHPKEFRDDFELSEEIAIVIQHSGNILSDGASSWPRSITGRPDPQNSRVAEHVRSIIRRVWGPDVEEDKEYCEVGTVQDKSITRRVSVFTTEEHDRKSVDVRNLFDLDF